MEQDIWDKILADSEMELPRLPMACGELDSVIFPRFLNSEEIQNLVLRRGIFMSDSAHRLLLASTNPTTGYLFHLTSTAYLETFEHNLYAYRVCHKSTYNSSSADSVSEEGATSQSYRNAFKEALEKKVPKEISDIKLKTGFDQLEAAPEVLILNPMSFTASIRMYQLYFSDQILDQDEPIGQFALVFMKHQHDVDLETYGLFLKEKIANLHKDLEKKLSKCPFVSRDLDEQDLSYQ
jgi:hypothetical protein